MSHERRKTVKMCVCQRKTFEALKEIAQEKGYTTADELIDNGEAGTGCGMCHPYLHKMMVTGEVRFIPGDVYIEVDP